MHVYFIFYTLFKGDFIMILACNHLSKAFTLQTVISDATFHLEDREKAAIVGINPVKADRR